MSSSTPISRSDHHLRTYPAFPSLLSSSLCRSRPPFFASPAPQTLEFFGAFFTLTDHHCWNMLCSFPPHLFTLLPRASPPAPQACEFIAAFFTLPDYHWQTTFPFRPPRLRYDLTSCLVRSPLPLRPVISLRPPSRSPTTTGKQYLPKMNRVACHLLPCRSTPPRPSDP